MSLHTDFLARRDFIRKGAFAGLGAGLLPFARAMNADAAQNRVRRYVTLGKTDIKMSDISFGSSRLGSDEEDLVLHALDLGINYFDTAESYSWGTSETTIGRALKGKRDKVYIASKTHAGLSDKKESMMRSLEQSLQKLQTDYVDVYFNHAVNDVDRMSNPEWSEFTALAKKQGKIRYSGMSGHAGNLIACLDYCIDNSVVDVFLIAYNFGQDPAFYQRFTRGFDFIARFPKLPLALARAKAKGVGVIAMKTLMGARLNDMRPYEKGGATFSQAAFRWVLSNPNVDSLIISMTSKDNITEFVGGSGWKKISRREVPILKKYARLNGTSYCRHACNDCAGACPENVPIADVLRTRMYATDYEDVRFAKAEYSMLGAGASACLTCSHQSCAGACTHGLPIEKMTAPTHELLTV
ncbi:MAG: aldo/keto reductase [Nitrospinae bacterium]|nr:aldo/keto reductase [Nitrospinota bacterium]